MTKGCSIIHLQLCDGRSSCENCEHNKHKFNPDYTVTPGEVLGEWLDAQKMTPELAAALEKLTDKAAAIWIGLAEDGK